MKQLISCVVLGCTLLVPGLAGPSRHHKSKPKKVVMADPYETSEQYEDTVEDPMDQDMDSGDLEWQNVKSSESAYQPASASTSRNCCHIEKRPFSKWSQILGADKTQCGEYWFVQKQNSTADETCASLGLSVPSGCDLPDKVKCCATGCQYKSSGKSFNPCSACHRDASESEPDHSDQSDQSDHNDQMDSYDEPNKSNKHEKTDLQTWKHRCKNVTLCVEPTCENCQAPHLLTFEDGTDQTCAFFVLDPKGTGFNTDYRDFKIMNGGVFDPWTNRCDCTHPSTLSGVISQQKLLTNSKASEPMEICRKVPFTLLSMFVTFSSPTDLKGTVKLFVSRKGTYSHLCTLNLKAGEPQLYKPEQPVCDIEKIKFQFASSKNYKFVNIDNMLLCM